MPSTTNFGYPYPAATAAPDVPGDIYNLANFLDNEQTKWAGFSFQAQNVTIGASGYQTGRFRRTGRKTVVAEYEIFLNGSGAAVSGDIAISLPTTSLGGMGTVPYWPSGTFTCTGTNGVNIIGVPVIGVSNADPLYFGGRTSGTAAAVGASTVSWGANSRIHVALTYAEA